MVTRPIVLYGPLITHYVHFRIETKIGSGNFGAVFNGAWVTRERTTEVAIKVLKTDSNVVERIKFLQEAAIMGQFHHPNIIHLHGVITMREPVRELLVRNHKTFPNRQ